MNFDKALSEAVDGAKVRAVNMQPGAYVSYEFAGWRINLAGGTSSGYTFKEIDKLSEWEFYKEPEAPKVPELSPLLAVAKVPKPKPVPTSEPKKRGRPAWTPPAVIDDISDHKTLPGVASQFNGNSPVATANPWAAIKPACAHENTVTVWGKVKCADCGEELT